MRKSSEEIRHEVRKVNQCESEFPGDHTESKWEFKRNVRQVAREVEI